MYRYVPLVALILGLNAETFMDDWAADDCMDADYDCNNCAETTTSAATFSNYHPANSDPIVGDTSSDFGETAKPTQILTTSEQPLSSHASSESLEACLASLDVVTPENPNFSHIISPWNHINNDTHPAVYVRATNGMDVAHAVKCAIKHSRTVTARSGGHSIAGFSRGATNGVVISLDKMLDLEISPTDTVWIGAGWRGGALIAKLFEHNLTVTTGSCSSVGVVGYSLGGGQGVHGRSLGYLSDSVLEYEVVSSEGEILNVSLLSHPLLFQALHGCGGGNFGIVTKMHVKAARVHPVYSVFSFEVMPNETAMALENFAAFMSTAPNSVDGYVSFQPGGQMMGNIIYAGPVDDLTLMTEDMARKLDRQQQNTTSGPLKEMYAQYIQASNILTGLNGSSIFSDVEPMSFAVKCHNFMLDALSPDLARAIAEVTRDAPKGTAALIEPLGGALMESTSGIPDVIANRKSQFMIELFALSPEVLTPEQEQWVILTYARLKTFGNGLFYVNFVNPSEKNHALALYGQYWDFLRQTVLPLYDPTLVFDFPLSIGRMTEL